MSATHLRAPVRIERTLPAPPEQVFRAWTDAESLRQWMLPGDIQRCEVRCDPRVGGRFEIVMLGEERYVQHGEYLVIDPPRRLVFSWFSASLPDARTQVSVELAATQDGGTRLVLVHEDLPDDPSYAGHEDGWGDILRHLGEHLAPAARRTT